VISDVCFADRSGAQRHSHHNPCVASDILLTDDHRKFVVRSMPPRPLADSRFHTVDTLYIGKEAQGLRCSFTASKEKKMTLTFARKKANLY